MELCITDGWGLIEWQPGVVYYLSVSDFFGQRIYIEVSGVLSNVPGLVLGPVVLYSVLSMIALFESIPVVDMMVEFRVGVVTLCLLLIPPL